MPELQKTRPQRVLGQLWTGSTFSLGSYLRSSAVEMQGCGQGLGRQLALARAKLDLSMPPEYCPNMQYHVVMVGFMTFEL